MQIMNILLLQKFAKRHTDSQASIVTWKKVVENAAWKNRTHILKDFPRAKMLKGNRARFEVKHNKYRLIGEILYAEQIVIVRFIGTHNEYDRIDPTTVDMRI